MGDFRWADPGRLTGPEQKAALFLLTGFRRGAGPTMRTDAELSMALDPLPAA